MFTTISLCLIASALAIEENHQTNLSGNNDIAFALQQAAKAQKEAKKWLDQNKGAFMKGMDKNANQGSSRRASPNRGSLGRASCPSRLFANQGDKAGKGKKEDKGGGCFSKGFPARGFPPEDVPPGGFQPKDVSHEGVPLESVPPKGVSPEGVSSPNPSFPGGHETLAPRKTKNLLIFVSFSMPEASLKSLFQEAQKQGAVLVMRGLYQDSFIQTAQKLQQLGIAVDIHPELFETHRITSVPTFVKIGNGHPLYSLKGNVTLDFALKKFDRCVGDPLVGNRRVGNQCIGDQPVNAQSIKEAS